MSNQVTKSQQYWNKLASEAAVPRAKILKTEKNWLATYADMRVGGLLVETASRYVKEATGYLLDIGCGPGKWTNLMIRNFTHVTGIGIDLSTEMLKQAKRRINRVNMNLVGMNAAKLGFPCGLFHLVTSVTVLQHILDDETWRNAIKEMVRVTKPNGHIIICEIASPIWHFKVRRVHEYVSQFEMVGARLIYWRGADPSYFMTMLGLIQYGRSFNPRKVYYFNKHAKFLSKLSMILATLARIIDFHAGKTISGLLAPHKIMVYEKRS
jgi:ubiquinone/menaquinone biosynthesis C-methylase UbiE